MTKAHLSSLHIKVMIIDNEVMIIVSGKSQFHDYYALIYFTTLYKISCFCQFLYKMINNIYWEHFITHIKWRIKSWLTETCVTASSLNLNPCEAVDPVCGPGAGEQVQVCRTMEAIRGGNGKFLSGLLSGGWGGGQDFPSETKQEWRVELHWTEINWRLFQDWVEKHSSRVQCDWAAYQTSLYSFVL